MDIDLEKEPDIPILHNHSCTQCWALVKPECNCDYPYERYLCPLCDEKRKAERV